MKKIAILIIINLLNSSILSQTNIIYKDTVFITNTSFNVFDSLIVQTYGSNVKGNRLFINRRSIEGTESLLLSNPIFFQNRIYFNYSNKIHKSFFYDIKTQKIVNNSNSFNTDISYSHFWILNDLYTGVYEINPISEEKVLLFDLNTEANIIKDENGTVYSNDEITKIVFFDNKSYLIEFTKFDDYSGYQVDTRYFYIKDNKFYNKTNNVVLKFDDNIYNDFSIDFLAESKDNKYVLVKGKIAGYDMKDDKLIYRIFDESGNYVSDVMNRRDNVNLTGLNMQKGKVYSYYLTSYTDILKSNKVPHWVIVPYEFGIKLEIGFFNIYNNIIINEASISKLNQNKLILLKNMVYAKHNYKFTNEYFQAYFNLYEFYSSIDQIKNRISDVAKLLTSEDKQNLSLINKYIVIPKLNKYSREEILEANKIINYLDTISESIYSSNSEKYNKYFSALKNSINKIYSKTAKNKDLILQIYLQKGLDINNLYTILPYNVKFYQTRNVVNGLSALYGYKFSNQQWTQIFSLFDWYKPSTKAPNFEPSTKNLVENLVKFEQEFKN